MPFKATKTAIPVDPVRVIVSGSEYADWLEVDMDSDVFTPADAFSFTAAAPDRRFLGAFREGQRCDIYVGEDRQMAGVIDEPEITLTPESARLKVSGRDLGAYLVDSEAKAEQFSHYTLGDLAKHLLRPEWGIKNVIVSNDDNRRVQLGKRERERFRPGNKQTTTSIRKPRHYTKIDPGQTIRQILDEHCMRAGVMWWMTASGDLFIGKPQYEQYVAFEFYLYTPGTKSAQRSNNVLKASVKRAISERYSEIVVVGESRASSNGKGAFDDDGTTTAKRAKKFRGVATDPDLVQRGITRRLIVTDNDALSDEMCAEKARAEMGKRRLSALVINVEIEGFKQDGKLFTVDTLARVVIEEAGIDDVFWISQRKFSEKTEKRRTSLTLHQKGVYLP